MSRPNKVIILIRNVSPNNFGGAEKYQIRLASKLAEYGYSPVIFSSSRQLRSEAIRRSLLAYKAPFCPNQNWSGWRNLLLGFFFLWELYLFFWYLFKFLKHRPLAVQIQSRDDQIAATLAGKLLKIRVIWGDHADFRTWVMQNVRTRFKNPIGKIILRLSWRPYKIVFVCNRDKRFFSSLQKKTHSNLVTIYNGAEDRKNEFRDTKPAPGSCCFIGRVVREKGMSELIRAFNSVARDYPKAKLHIFGDGNVGSYATNEDSGGQIVFRGYLDDPIPELAKSEIFILPSYSEGLSLSLVEACMLGKAIITTDVGGSSEIIHNKENGLLVPPKNSAALEAALRELLRDKTELKRLSKQARLSYEAGFDFDKIFLNDIIKLYE